MDVTMNPDEIVLARRVIDLRGTDFKARRNRLRDLKIADHPTMAQLNEKGHVSLHQDGYWRMTGQGIQQLKLQIGEFSLRSR